MLARCHGLRVIHIDLLWSQSWTAVGTNEILLIETPCALSAGIPSMGSFPIPCPCINLATVTQGAWVRGPCLHITLPQSGTSEGIGCSLPLGTFT